MKIATIVGARPQFIKAAALSRVLRTHHQEILIHTGQHFDSNMSDIFFQELEIPEPDYNLGISGGSHAVMTGKMLIALEKILLQCLPDVVLLYGDTNSTLAGALVSVKLGIPIIHVEAGNRLGTLSNPEEVNRITTDHLSTLLFCAVDSAKASLEHEGLGTKAFVVGNVMYDAFLYYSSKLEGPLRSIVGFDGNMISIPDKYYYMTCHRAENTSDKQTLVEILKAMNSLDAPTIYPVHPRNRQSAIDLRSEYNFNNIIMVPPVGYLESIALTKHAAKIVTDSGGLQTEAFYAQVQCVTIFNYVCWPETMVDNRNQLSKPNCIDILEKLSRKQTVNSKYQPFGSGDACQKIVEHINQFFERIK